MFKKQAMLKNRVMLKKENMKEDKKILMILTKKNSIIKLAEFKRKIVDLKGRKTMGDEVLVLVIKISTRDEIT